jgi:hypothetical protein
MLGGGEYLHKQNSFKMRLHKLKKKEGRVRSGHSDEHLVCGDRNGQQTIYDVSNSRSTARLLPWKGRMGTGVPSLPRGEEKRWIPSDPLQQLGDDQGQEGDDAEIRERERPKDMEIGRWRRGFRVGKSARCGGRAPEGGRRRAGWRGLGRKGGRATRSGGAATGEGERSPAAGREAAQRHPGAGERRWSLVCKGATKL